MARNSKLVCAWNTKLNHFSLSEETNVFSRKIYWKYSSILLSWRFAELLLENMLSRSHWPRGLKRGSAAARLLGLRLRIPPGAWNSVAGVVCCQVHVYAAGFHSSRGVLPSVGRLSMIVKLRHWIGPGPLGTVEPYKNIVTLKFCGFQVQFILQLIFYVKLFRSRLHPKGIGSFFFFLFLRNFLISWGQNFRIQQISPYTTA